MERAFKIERPILVIFFVSNIINKIFDCIFRFCIYVYCHFVFTNPTFHNNNTI